MLVFNPKERISSAALLLCFKKKLEGVDVLIAKRFEGDFERASKAKELLEEKMKTM